MRLIIPFIIFFIFSFLANGQVGGKTGYDFVNFPLNAKAAAIGGINVSSRDGDVNMIHSNPGLMNSSMAGKGAISFVPFFADISGTQLSYVFKAGKTKQLFGAGLQYFNYGSAKRTDETGLETGTVYANDFVITASHARNLNNFTLGANAKLVGSQIDVYSSYALFVDFGATWKHPMKDFSIGILAKNIGFPIKNYANNRWVAIPIDVQAGVSYKLEHLPFRFSFTIHHLHRWDIAYDDPNFSNTTDLNGNQQRVKVPWYDNLIRHFVFGGEFFLTKGFHIRGGYNHMVRSELRLPNEFGASGFSFGVMLRIKSVELAYSSMFLHTVGNTNLFTLGINFGAMSEKFKKKVEEPPVSN
ncbi:MAG: type IX secretion system protein PorQ [Bacteroidota bacterium]|nr:type IX secretion system protein PorQ [Bacteroidota bacterium]